MLLNTIINENKIDLQNKKYIKHEISNKHVYVIYEDKCSVVLFATDIINKSNFYTADPNVGMLIEMNLNKGKIYTQKIRKKNDIFIVDKKSINVISNEDQCFKNETLKSIFSIGEGSGYNQTIYSHLNKELTALIFSNYFMNTPGEMLSYKNINKYIDDMYYDETLLEYLKRKGPSVNTFNLLKSTIDELFYYKIIECAFRRMYDGILFNRTKKIEVLEDKINEYFKNILIESKREVPKKLVHVCSFLDDEDDFKRLLNLIDNEYHLYMFDEFIGGLENPMKNKVYNFVRDFIRKCKTEYLSSLIETLYNNISIDKDIILLDKFIECFYRFKEIYDLSSHIVDGKVHIKSLGVSYEYLYYCNKVKKVNDEYNTNITYFPEDLVSAIQVVNGYYFDYSSKDNNSEIKSVVDNSKVVEIFGDKATDYDIEIGDNISLKLPKTRADFMKEGIDLENGAAGYYELVKGRKCMVLFLRHTDNINKCVCTLEFDTNMTRLVNVSCKNNSRLDEYIMRKEIKALTDFCNKNNIDCSCLKSLSF